MHYVWTEIIMGFHMGQLIAPYDDDDDDWYFKDTFVHMVG